MDKKMHKKATKAGHKGEYDQMTEKWTDSKMRPKKDKSGSGAKAVGEF